MSEQTTNHEFRAETRKVLNILTHSLYSNREIFLRELISNASDALDKLRFLQSQTQHEAIRDAELPLEIRISSDKVQNCLTITDTGIGMTRDEMIENLGTIAHSGSEAFLKEHTQTAEDGTTSDASNIIGRFGIGFYSVFMVADKVEVTSLSATGDGPAYRWISDGTGTFTVEEAPDQADIKRGTTIRAFIKESDKEFLEKYRIEGIIRTHSSFIPFPILVDGERVNTTPALWREPKFSIKKEQYDEFYKFLTYDQKDPLDVLHLSVDAPVQFNALLFIPGHAPYDYYTREYEKGLQLYASGVLIMEKCPDLLSDYFSFVKGIVDSQDLSLNISREMLQKDSQLKLIHNALEKKIKSELTAMKNNERDKYEEFFKNFGRQLKYGCYSDYGTHSDLLKDLLLFYSAKEKKLVSLEEYVKAMPEGQKYIYFAAGEDADRLAKLPAAELVLDKGYDLLLLTEDVDEFCLQMMRSYEEKEFKNINSGDLGLETEEEKKQAEEAAEENKPLFEAIKAALGDKVTKVTLSTRLKSHPVCLSSEGPISIEMERVLKGMPGGEAPKSEKVLELNPNHPVFETMKSLHATGDTEKLNAYADILYNQARLIEGLPVEDAVAYTEAVCKLMK